MLDYLPFCYTFYGGKDYETDVWIIDDGGVSGGYWM
jgi:hypothetical protein